MPINEITIEDIKQLNPVQLSDVLLRLLKAESDHRKISGIKEIVVPLNINEADDGMDGRIECEDTKDSRWIMNKLSLYQSKATKLTPQKLYNEFFHGSVKKGLALKPAILDTLDQGGQYVFFISHPYSPKSKKALEKKASDAISYCIQHFEKKYVINQVRILDANSIKDWVNEYFSVVIVVKEYCHQQIPLGFKTIDRWGEFSDFQKIKYISNKTLDQYIDAIRTTSKDTKKSIRILGHSGLGKSRLIFEAFKGKNYIERDVIYYEYTDSISSLVDFVGSYCNSLRGTLIVDNCNYETFIRLKNEIKRDSSSLNLVTIDFSVEEENEPSRIDPDTNYIYLKSDIFHDIIPELIKEMFGSSLLPDQIDYIANYSDGYPKMALLFAEAAKSQNLRDFSQFIDNSLIDKLLFGRDYFKINVELMSEIAQVCSIFSKFGSPIIENKYLDDKSKKMIQTHLDVICNKLSDSKFKERDFKNACVYFVQKQIFEKRGRYLVVRPLPLAIRLAMKWWQNRNPTEIQNFLPLLISSGLSQLMVERLKYLDQLSEAQTFVSENWGPDSPFANAEVLNTEMGSQLFRTVIEVNPKDTFKTLLKAFSRLTKEQLVQVNKGRRNIVWALEKFCFRSDTFNEASKLLYDFAVAENETWSNNSQGQFIQLFQIYLSGTEVSFDQRLKTIEYGFSKKDDDYIFLAIKALGRGLLTQGFSRMIGSENFGTSTPRKDYYPKSSDEIFRYHISILNKLIEIANLDSKFVDKVLDAVSKSIRGLLAAGEFNLIKNHLLILNKFSTSPWLGAIDALRTTLKYEKYSTEEINQIEQLIEDLSSTSMDSKLKIFVSNAGYDHVKVNDEKYIDMAEKRAIDFAMEIINENINLTPYLYELNKGRQDKGFIFGKTFSENYDDIELLIDNIISTLESIKSDERNLEFLRGLIFALNEDQQKTIVFSIAKNENLSKCAFYLARFYLRKKDDIIYLLNNFDNDTISDVDLINLVHAHYFDTISATELIEIMDKVLYLSSNSQWMIVEMIFFFYQINNNNLDNILSDYFLKLHHNFNFFISTPKISLLDDYNYTELVKVILKRRNDKFAEIISNNISVAMSLNSIPFTDIYISEISSILVNNYFTTFWTYISNCILKNDYSFLNVGHILGSHHGNSQFNDRLGILFQNEKGYDEIIDWCNNNKFVGLYRIAHMMPISDLDENNCLVWHPFAKRMIEQFGEVDDFLSQVTANMNSFGWVGSTIPYYEQQKSLVMQFHNHESAIIRTWVNDMVEYYDKVIMTEKFREEERF